MSLDNLPRWKPKIDVDSGPDRSYERELETEIARLKSIVAAQTTIENDKLLDMLADRFGNVNLNYWRGNWTCRVITGDPSHSENWHEGENANLRRAIALASAKASRSR